jgi:hypothetical protein
MRPQHCRATGAADRRSCTSSHIVTLCCCVAYSCQVGHCEQLAHSFSSCTCVAAHQRHVPADSICSLAVLFRQLVVIAALHVHRLSLNLHVSLPSAVAADEGGFGSWSCAAAPRFHRLSPELLVTRAAVAAVADEGGFGSWSCASAPHSSHLLSPELLVSLRLLLLQTRAALAAGRVLLHLVFIGYPLNCLCCCCGCCCRRRGRLRQLVVYCCTSLSTATS